MSAQRDAALSFACAWATQLTAMLGLPPSVASRLAARRYDVDPADIFVEHVSRLSRVWKSGSTRRPTARPADRATRAAIEVDEKERTGT